MSLQTLLKIHGLIAIKRKITEEKRWLKLNVPVPSENCTPPDQLLIAAYEKLLFENTNGRVVIGKEIIASDLSSLTSNGWLTLSIMKRFAELLNTQSSQTLILVLNDLIGLNQDLIKKLLAKEKGKHVKYLTLIINVGCNGTETFVAKPGKQGCHWTILYIDTTTNKWLYCDTLAWAPPDDLTKYVNSLIDTFTLELSLPRKPAQGRFVAHKPECRKAGVHHCSQNCFQNIPLQTCGSVCRVIALIMTPISCIDPKLWKFSFLDNGYKLPEQLLWLMHPTSYAPYMRRVLIHWLMAKHVDLKLLGISSSLKPKGAIPESLQFKNLSTRSDNCNATQKDGKQQEFEFDTDNHPLSTHTSSVVFDCDKEQSGPNNTPTSNADDYFLDGSNNHGADLHSKAHVAESKVKNHLIHHSLSDEHVHVEALIDLDTETQDTKSEATNSQMAGSEGVEEANVVDDLDCEMYAAKSSIHLRHPQWF
jgi:hypothetical protein